MTEIHHRLPLRAGMTLFAALMLSACTVGPDYRSRGDQSRIAVAERQIAIDRHLLDLVEQRFAKGLSTEREVAQAEALTAEAEASLQPLRIDLEAQLNRLDVLMGAQPGHYAAELSSPAAPAVIPSAAGADDAGALLRRRPDVIAAERKLAASNARIGQALAEYYQKVSLSGLLGVESLSSGHLFDGAAFQPMAIGGLRWRLFDFGRIDAEVAAARGSNEEALATYRLSVLQAAEDVENAFMRLVQSKAHAEDIRRQIVALTHARDLSQTAYRSGAIALTDVLDADRQLLHAEDELARTEADTARAAVSTFRALGGGWSI